MVNVLIRIFCRSTYKVKITCINLFNFKPRTLNTSKTYILKFTHVFLFAYHFRKKMIKIKKFLKLGTENINKNHSVNIFRLNKVEKIYNKQKHMFL